MTILPFGVAVLDEPDQLCDWVRESGKLCHDEGVEKHYLPFINPGDVVIDAGAAIGDHTIAYMEKCGVPANVHAFECNPKMVECLRHNCQGAQIYPFALGCTFGTVKFNEWPGNLGASHIHRYDGNDVPCIPLDSLMLPRVDFIKLDVEGWEVQSIFGARETIMRCRPRMIVEFNGPFLERSEYSVDYLERTIRDCGYTVEILMGSREEGRYEGLCLPRSS